MMIDVFPLSESTVSKSASVKFQAFDFSGGENIPTQQANHHHHRGFHCDSANGKYCSALGIQATTGGFFLGGVGRMAKGRTFQVQCEAYMIREVRKLVFLKKFGMLAWFVVSFEMVDNLEHVFLFRKNIKKPGKRIEARSLQIAGFVQGKKWHKSHKMGPYQVLYNWGYLSTVTVLFFGWGVFNFQNQYTICHTPLQQNRYTQVRDFCLLVVSSLSCPVIPYIHTIPYLNPIKPGLTNQLIFGF